MFVFPQHIQPNSYVASEIVYSILMAISAPLFNESLSEIQKG